MSAVAEKTLITPEEFLKMPDRKDFELIDGRLVTRNGNALSSWIGGRILGRIGELVDDPMKRGWLFPANLGLQCFSGRPDSVRRCNVSFIKPGRLTWDQLTDGWLRIVPDLVVEVVYPNDKVYEFDEKVEMFLKAGVPLIWIVLPNIRSVRIIRGDGSTAILREADELFGEDIIPGFVCPVSSIFPPIPATPAEAQANA